MSETKTSRLVSGWSEIRQGETYEAELSMVVGIPQQCWNCGERSLLIGQGGMFIRARRSNSIYAYEVPMCTGCLTLEMRSRIMRANLGPIEPLWATTFRQLLPYVMRVVDEAKRND